MGTRLVGQLRTEAELSKPGLTWNSCHTTNTSSWTNIHYNSIVCRFCTSQRERACLDLFWTYESVQQYSLSRALRLSAVSQVWGRTGLKTRVMNNLLATFCLHFTRTFILSNLHVQNFTVSRVCCRGGGAASSYIYIIHTQQHCIAASALHLPPERDWQRVAACDSASSSLWRSCWRLFIQLPVSLF